MPKIGFSGSTLKLIAIITMLIDHIGAAVIARLLIAGQGSEMLYKIYYAKFFNLVMYKLNVY